jgi:RimK-like ATP-grasp domain
MASPGLVAVFGDLQEGPCELLVQALRALGGPVLLLDALRGEPTAVPWALGPGGGLTGTVSSEDGPVPLAALQGLYLRPGDTRRRPPGDDAARHARRQAWAQGWVDVGELSPARVANRLSAMNSNASKPLQSQVLAACGFAVPPMLLSNEPEAVLDFEARHGALIFKSASGVRSIVRPLDGQARQRLHEVSHTPVLFQKRLSGTNVRVHVVGEALFATEIDSDGLDYRYAGREGASTSLRATTLPLDVQACCHRAAQRLALPFAGLDLMLADDGQVYCFEANPSPGYSYYENATGQPIAAALARWLAGVGD